MSESAEAIKGSCLCGEIAYSITTPILAMGHCHCSMCRRAHGTAYSTYCQIDSSGLCIDTGADAVQGYPSSPGVERQFCRHCGAKLFYRNEALPEFVWVAAGTLDDEPGVEPTYHIFVESRAPWHEIADGLPQHAAFPPGAEH